MFGDQSKIFMPPVWRVKMVLTSRVKLSSLCYWWWCCMPAASIYAKENHIGASPLSQFKPYFSGSEIIETGQDE